MKQINDIFLSFFVWIIFSGYLLAQDSKDHKSHYLSFEIPFIQLKEEANYGFVHKGFDLYLGYDFEKQDDERILIFESDVSFGAVFRKGIGLYWLFKPVDFYYGFKKNIGENKSLHLGPYIAANYQWQLYPELQSGHKFWYNSFETGFKASLKTKIKEKNFDFFISNSFFGFVSRPNYETEQYYYYLQFSSFVEDFHSNLKFGTLNLFNHTNFEIRWINLNNKELSLVYRFEYFGYYEHPYLGFVTHSIKVRKKIGKSN